MVVVGAPVAIVVGDVWCLWFVGAVAEAFVVLLLVLLLALVLLPLPLL